MCPAGLEQQAQDQSDPRRTSTASARSQCFLPDPNSKQLRIRAFPAWPQQQRILEDMPDRMPERTSEYMPGTKARKNFRYSQNICQKECQTKRSEYKCININLNIYIYIYLFLSLFNLSLSLSLTYLFPDGMSEAMSGYAVCQREGGDYSKRLLVFLSIYLFISLFLYIYINVISLSLSLWDIYFQMVCQKLSQNM